MDTHKQQADSAMLSEAVVALGNIKNLIDLAEEELFQAGGIPSPQNQSVEVSRALTLLRSAKHISDEMDKAIEDWIDGGAEQKAAPATQAAFSDKVN